jgi:hypothetical protein
MFRSIRIETTLVILFTAAPQSYGQTTVWLSDNATFADMDNTTAAPPGTTGSFDIWIKTGHSNRLVNIALDLMAMGDAIQFTGADVVIGQDRFQVQGEPILGPEMRTITGIDAYAGVGGQFLGTGIGSGVPVDDEGLDAYRFAKVHYRIAGRGTSDLQLKVGSSSFEWTFGGQSILHLGIDDPINENVGGATDSIIDGRIRVVPEPVTALLLFLSGCLLFIRRRPDRQDGHRPAPNWVLVQCPTPRARENTRI